MNRWCPEINDLKRKREDDEDEFKESKKARLEEQTIIDEGEDIAFTKLAELAREANEDKWESKVDKYVNDGLTEEEARLNANRKLNGVDLNQIMSSYGTLIQYILQLKNGKLHFKVMKVVDNLLEDGMDYKKAVTVAIREYKHVLENYLDEVIDNENSDEDATSDDDDDDDDDDDEEEEEEEED
jgi:uncharacterized protein YnzC (UPF0291/DUF896 family)